MITSYPCRRDCNTQKHLETVDKQHKTSMTCQKELMRCLTRTVKRKREDNMHMTLIRKESTSSTHLHLYYSYVHPHQTAMHLGKCTKSYNIRFWPLPPKEGPEWERKHHKKTTQDFWSDSPQTSLFTISHAFFFPSRTASSTSSIPIPYPMPYIVITVSMQLGSQFCIEATCSREAYEPFGFFFFFLVFPFLPSSSSPRPVSSISPKISASSHLSFPFHNFLLYSFLILYYLPLLTHTLDHQSKSSHIKSSHLLKFKARGSLDHL